MMKIKIGIIKVGTAVLNAVYAFMKFLPVRKKVTMLSRQDNKPSDEFLMVRKGIKLRDERVKVVLLCHTLDGGADSSLSDKIKYGFHMLVQMFHIATSKVAILDSYCIVVSILNHRKDLKVIQMWHSMGTMKKFGYTSLDTEEGSRSEIAYAMKMHRNYIFASSDAYKDHLASGFGYDAAKIMTMPLPRLDLLNSEKYEERVREKIYGIYPEFKEKPVILYCPTFRKNEEAFARALKELYREYAAKPFLYNVGTPDFRSFAAKLPEEAARQIKLDSFAFFRQAVQAAGLRLRQEESLAYGALSALLSTVSAREALSAACDPSAVFGHMAEVLMENLFEEEPV